jgi:hypothetical protein
MTFPDICNYIIRHNLDTASRKKNLIHKRMYLYAYLYYNYKKSLVQIAKMFNKADHVTIRHALISGEYVQHYDNFIEDTKDLMELAPFIIPPYINKVDRKALSKSRPRSLRVTVTLSQKQFNDFIKTQDEHIILDLLWKQFTKSTRNDKC